MVFFAFQAGGYFPGPTAWGVVLLGGLALVRLVAGRGPLLALGRLGRLALVAVALLAGLTLLSAVWSGSPWRALVEFDRVVLYGLVFALFASMALTTTGVRVMARGLAVAFVLVCMAALSARLVPDLYPVAVTFDGYGLDHPVTYANTLGLAAVLGALLCLHLSADGEELPRTQVLGAAAVPILVTALVLTGSYGAALAGVVGLVAYAVSARPPKLVGALVAVVPTTALAAVAASSAQRLASADATSVAALADGRMVAAVVGLSVANAALVRWLVLRFGGPVGAHLAALMGRRGLVAGAIVAVLVVAGGLALAAGTMRGAGSAARVDHWQVAVAGFAQAPLTGNGAGTYELLSQRERGLEATVRDGHSLALETLAELGLVGLTLLTAALGCTLVCLIRRLREPERGLVAAVLAVSLAWLAHSSIDWDWEMPVVTLPVFALCGAVLGMSRGEPPKEAPRIREEVSAFPAARAVMVALVLSLVAIAALVAVSQSQLRGTLLSARGGDCGAVARASARFPLSARPDGREVLGRCELVRARSASGPERADHAERAAAAFAQAVRRDPQDRLLRADLSRALRLARAGPARSVRARR